MSVLLPEALRFMSGMVRRLLLVLALLSLAKDSGLRIAILPGSPVLPLPVEFVAGGEGSPEP